MITDTKIIQNEILGELKNLLSRYYPEVVDYDDGGFYSNYDSSFNRLKHQEKMIVTQSRHIWSCSKAAEFFEDKSFENYAIHGEKFIDNKMWDHTYGGYFQIRDKHGNISDAEGWYDEKRAYGNAFAIYGLSALYHQTKEPKYLDQAIKTFQWLEKYSYDNVLDGYHQFFQRNNKTFYNNSEYQSKAKADYIEIGYKDQNSSIHLLEAYTELYNNWKDEELKKQLNNLLLLIRDKLTNPKGYLHLFFDKELNPLLFHHSTKEEALKTYQLEHISFGHNYETAFLLLEASFALGLENDTATLEATKKMADHAIEFGWDKTNYGFFDGGYNFADGRFEIIQETKNWWAQAEALNIYLMLYLIFEDEKYLDIFLKSWEYIKINIIDNKINDWFWNGIDTCPEVVEIQKSSIWKCTYHNARALSNCYIMLSNINNQSDILNDSIQKLKSETKCFINNWKNLV